MDKELKKTPSQEAELRQLMDEISELATDVISDYTEDPSDMSGSYHYVHGLSPVLQHQEAKDRITTTTRVEKNTKDK
tara:strand:- start:174 stop:404 length:231 start_codon:yes stop_codon:yes gene_type:complete